MTIDPRIAERRHAVQESGARRGVRRALWVLVAITVIAAGIGLAKSSVFSIASVTITGTDSEWVLGVLDDLEMGEGTPLIRVRTELIAEAILAEPTVRDVFVDAVFPDALEIEVLERDPVAWVWAGGRFALVDIEGVVIGASDAPLADRPVIRLVSSAPDPGDSFSDEVVLGAIVFAAALPYEYRATQIRLEVGELWATVQGYQIRLGRVIDMVAKAGALAAVLDDGPPGGSLINLIAPSRPAVTPPSS